jgi:hypothetical protein
LDVTADLALNRLDISTEDDIIADVLSLGGAARKPHG